MTSTDYENMDPELRKEIARDKVRKTTLIRVLIAAMMVGLTIYLKLTGMAAVVMIAAAVYILITMIPVWKLMNQNMKFRDEESEEA